MRGHRCQYLTVARPTILFRALCAVVPPDLRQDESLMQLFDTLEHLDTVVDDVFGRIEAKVASSRDQLIAVNNRINVVRKP